MRNLMTTYLRPLQGSASTRDDGEGKDGSELRMWKAVTGGGVGRWGEGLAATQSAPNARPLLGQ